MEHPQVIKKYLNISEVFTPVAFAQKLLDKIDLKLDNEVVCHKIPNSKQILQDRDIINIDVTPILNGYHGDTSRMFLFGNPSAVAKKLVEVTQESMMRGIAEIKSAARIGDIGTETGVEILTLS